MDDGLVASTDPEWIQGAFDTLTGLFDRVELCKNIDDMVDMLLRTCRVSGNQSETLYERRMTGERLTYQER